MPKTTKDACFDDLKRRILTMDLAPGSALDEVSLSDHYHISRTPLREVLQRLAGAGYVKIESNRGAKVTSMDVTEMRVFFQTAPLVYANISRLAALAGTSAQLDRIRELQKRFRAAILLGDASATSIANHAFHATIGDMAHNPYLSAALDRMLIDHARLGQTFYSASDADDQHRIETAADQHDELIDALSSRDSQLAVNLTLAHWDLSRDRMERFVRPDPLPIEMFGSKERADAV